jgi:outer membrane protein TolC
MQHSRSGRLAVPALLLAIQIAAGAAPAEEPSPAAADEPSAVDLPSDPTLEDFLRVAERRNPELQAAESVWRAQSEAARAAGSFPDPKLSVGAMLSEVETRVGPQQQTAALMQRLPWFGKLGLREDAAEASADAAEARRDDLRLQLRRDVTLAWLDLYWLSRAVDLTRENLDLLANLEGVIRAKYRAATAGHADLARVQVELGKVEDRVRSLEDRLRPATARMNALLRRPPAAPVPLPRNLPEVPPAPESVTVLAALRESSPRLREREHEVAGAAAGARLASRNRWPDWTVGVKWIGVGQAVNPMLEDSGRDALMVDVTVDLPIFRGKYSGAVRAAEEKLAAARSRRTGEEDALSAQAEAILFEWRDADRRAELYGGALLPKARESLAATSAAYRTGDGGFLDLIDAQRTLLDLELENERAATDRGRSAARLATLIGADPGPEVPR